MAIKACSPLISIVPSSICEIPARIRESVDLPEPFVPKIPTTSPLGIVNVISFKA